jgi:hypothetical protein
MNWGGCDSSAWWEWGKNKKLIQEGRQQLYSDVQDCSTIRYTSTSAEWQDTQPWLYQTRHTIWKGMELEGSPALRKCPILNLHATQFLCDCYSAPDEVWAIKYCHDEWRLPVERCISQLQRKCYCVHTKYNITTVNDTTMTNLTEAQKTDRTNLLLAYFLHHRTIVTVEEYHYRRKPSVHFLALYKWALHNHIMY